MAEDGSFLERDADGRWFRITPVGNRRCKVEDIMSPTGVFWFEDADNIGVKIWPVTPTVGQAAPETKKAAPSS
jgi:hypothetical protein